MQRKVVLVARLFLFVSAAMGIYFLISNLILRESLKKISKAVAVIKDKDSQQNKKLQEDIRRDLEEKYRADMISYQVVTKRLEQKKIMQESQKGGNQ